MKNGVPIEMDTSHHQGHKDQEGDQGGAQTALLEARFQFAAEHGADLAKVVTSPDSASQRNAERKQFRVAHSRRKWQK